jgi:hypothetical protein
MKIYGRCTANSTHQVLIDNSKLFQEYIGLSFSQAAYLAFSKQVVLIGVHDPTTDTILMNPGSEYILVCLWFAFAPS